MGKMPMPHQTFGGTDRDPLALFVLMLNNGSAASNLADYFFYPRRVDLIDLNEPFTSADLNAHMGGCLIYYGTQAGKRLDSFRTRLKEILCSGEGCLYSIER